MDGEREAREELSPVGLTIGELGRMTKDFEILVIRKDFKLVGTTFEVMPPFTKSFDDSEKFTIIDIVISFGFNERLGHEGDGMPKTIRTVLRKDGATSIFRGVAFKAEGGGEIGLDQDGSSEKTLFQPIKGVLFRFSPLPRGSFLGEVVKRASKAGVVTNELTIETCKTKECMDVFEFCRSGPICNTSKFDRVHSELASLETDTKVFNLILLEFTLLWFEEELIGFEDLKDLADDATMFFHGASGDENIIHIDKDCTGSNEIFEEFIHHCLERGG